MKKTSKWRKYKCGDCGTIIAFNWLDRHCKKYHKGKNVDFKEVVE